MSVSWFSGKVRVVLVAVVLAAAGAYWFWGRSAPELKWRTAKIEKGDIKVSVTATGTLQAVLTVQVGTQVSGTISAIYADFNSQVKKGQVVARIDTTLLHAALTDALSNLEKAAAQERQASDELKRTQTLFARSLVSQSDLDQSTANARVAVANLSSARAQVDRARINLRYATIISPIDGIVLSRAVDVGQTVAASFNTPTLFTLAGDLRQMQVQASVDEADIGKIKMGQKSDFTVDAYPDSTFSGQVSQIRLQPVTVQNVVSYVVVIDVPNPGLRLMPGMTANLTIVVDGKEDVLMVPVAALRFMPPDVEGRKKGGKPGEPGNHTPGTHASWADKGNGGDTSGGAKGADRSSRADTSRRAGADTSGGAGWKGHGSGGGHRGGADSGRIFILENGKPKPVRVKVGLTDGTHTEISNGIEPGTDVITGVESTQAGSKSQAAPFGMQRAPGGGGGRFH